MDPLQFPILIAALLGLLVGSFLNVVALRFPPRLMHRWRREAREILELEAVGEDVDPTPPSLVWQRSACPQCKRQLTALENIPLLSYLALRGRCYGCKTRISPQYPLVEAACALASAVAIQRYGATPEGAVALVGSWILLALSVIDLRTFLLPDELTFPLLWLGLLAATQGLFQTPSLAIQGAALGYLSLWSVYWLFKLTTGKEGMGYGDFKLLAGLGAFVGPSGLVGVILLSSVVGIVIGGASLALAGRDRSHPIPFGPYLAIAGWLQWMSGQDWLALYMNFIAR